MAIIVDGELYMKLDGKLAEIKRQIRQREGYPYDPNLLDQALQAVIEGKFDLFKGLSSQQPSTQKQEEVRQPTVLLVRSVPDLVQRDLVALRLPKKFIARERFVRDVSTDASVRISRIGENFKELFLSKIEEPPGETFLYRYAMSRPMLESEILKQLKSRAVWLAAIYAFLVHQHLVTSTMISWDFVNIFPARDSKEQHRCVLVCWERDGWSIDALDVARELPGETWHEDNLVFAR